MANKSHRTLQFGLIAVAMSAAIATTALAFAPAEPADEILMPVRVTNVEKNQAWPVKGRITMRPCAVVECIEL